MSSHKSETRISQREEERRINDWLRKRESGRFKPMMGTYQRRERNRQRREAEALQRRLAQRHRRRQRLGAKRSESGDGSLPTS